MSVSGGQKSKKKSKKKAIWKVDVLNLRFKNEVDVVNFTRKAQVDVLHLLNFAHTMTAIVHCTSTLYSTRTLYRYNVHVHCTVHNNIAFYRGACLTK